jgi:pimeloyl-ACP methyl ester carboxylesterase
VAASLDLEFTLNDGRKIEYALMGDRFGKPAFLFHGFPGSRLTWRNMDEPGKRHGLRIIAPDRPGYGLSDFQPNRRLLDWPRDIAALAYHLGIQQFSVLGISGGGPHAAACAYQMPERLKAAVIVSGQGPLDTEAMWNVISPRVRRLFRLAHRAPFIVQIVMGQMSKQVRSNPEEFVRRAAAFYAAPDREIILANPALRQMIAETYVEGFRQGVKGAAHEAWLFASSWGFRLQDIRMRMHLWQGEADTETPLAMGRYQADAIPDCKAHFIPGEGHFSIMVHCMDEILAAL